MLGYILTFLSTILWGVHPIFTHYFVKNLDPLYLSGVVSVISSLPFILQLTYTKKLNIIVSQKYLKKAIPLAFLASTGWALLFIGTKLTTGANTGILLQIEPVYSIIIAAIFLREVIKTKQIVATIFMIIGAVIVVYKGNAGFNWGDVLVLLAPLFFQFSHAIGKKLFSSGMTTSMVLAGRQLFGGIMFLLIYFIFARGGSNIIPYGENLVAGIVLGLLEFLELVLWYSAIKRIPLSKASAFLPFAAVFSLFASVLLLNEKITLQHYIGLFFVMMGFIILTYNRLNKTSKVLSI